jgi:hypothetical protein
LEDRKSVPVYVEYTAELRPLAGETKGFLWQFGDSFGVPDLPSRFEEELLVRQDGQVYWMPVEVSILTAISTDLEVGEWGRMNVRLLGSLQVDPGYRAISVITGILE